MKIYNDLDLNGNRLLGVANMPNDLLSVALLHAIFDANPIVKPTYTETSAGSGVYEWHDIDEYVAAEPVGTENPKALGWYERSGEGTELDPYVYTLTTDTEVDQSKTYYIKQWTDNNFALCYAYRAADGTIMVIPVDINNFLSEAEFKKGLEVVNGEVNVKIDPTSDSYLTVSQNGVKLSGISEIIETLDLDIDHISLPQDIYTYYNIGKIQNASGTSPQLVASEGDTLKDLFDNLFKMDEAQPSISSNPSITALSLSSKATGSLDNQVIGTVISTVTYSISTSQGKYTYQAANDTGVTWSNFALSGSTFNTVSSENTSGTLDLTTDYVVGKSNSFDVTALGTHSAGSVAKTNLGNNSDPEVKIEAGTKSKTSTFSVSGLYPAFYGFSSEEDADNIQSVINSGTMVQVHQPSGYKAEDGWSTTATLTNGGSTNLRFWLVTRNESTAKQLGVSAVAEPVTKSISVKAFKAKAVGSGDNPQTLGLYESNGIGGYVLTTDTAPVNDKTYYENVDTVSLGNYYVYKSLNVFDPDTHSFELNIKF